MTFTEEVFLVAGMTLVTFGVRYLPLLVAGRVELPAPLLRALRYVPVAVLTAISVPAVLMPDGRLDLSPQNAYLFGGIAAVLIAWKTRSLLPTIVGGMAVFLIWRLLLPA